MVSGNPKVSVLMTVYNGEKFLRESIESILCQTFDDFEFIIIDDGSTDASPNIMASFSDPRLVFVQQENIGQTKSLNKGLHLARGEYVARQDADDISLPDRFEKQAAYLDAHPEVVVVGGSVIRVDEQGNALRRLVFPQTHRKVRKRLRQGINPLVHTTVMFRRREIVSLGGYNEHFPVIQDCELWFRVSECFRLANLPDVLCYYRFHPKSLSSSYTMDRALLALRIGKGKRSCGTYPATSSDWESSVEGFEAEFQMEIDAWKRQHQARRMLKLSQARFAAGDLPGALRYLWQSIRVYPKISLSIPVRMFRYIRSCIQP